MSDEYIRKMLRNALAARQKGLKADFEATFAAAERKYSRAENRYRATAAMAAAVVIVVVFYGLVSSQNEGIAPDYLDEQALLGTTAWTAPSDALMPQYQYDVYRDLPVLIEFTDLQQGSLL